MANAKRRVRYGFILALFGISGLMIAWFVLGRDKVPPATPEQIQLETAFLKEHFFTDPCFEPLREAKSLEGRFDNSPTYLVRFFVPSLAHDFLAHAIVVRHEDRKAYLVRAGGLTGGYEEVGPISIAKCLRPTFPIS